jgi:3-methyladenine DNA glycosylase AlkD
MRSEDADLTQRPQRKNTESTEKMGKEKQAWSAEEVIGELRRLGTRENVEGMARFGIRAVDVFGVSKPKLDGIAKKIGKNHELGLALWATGNHDAKILAGMISEPRRVTAAQMESWVRDFDNWDTCDGTCCHLFVFAAPAWSKAVNWTRRKEEFQKRAGFALAAYLAYRDKTASDAKFGTFLKRIEREADDDRNFVRKAVNWALRNIGKRNVRLNAAAIATGERLRKRESRAARWIAADALRELQSDAVQERLGRKKHDDKSARKRRVADSARSQQ